MNSQITEDIQIVDLTIRGVARYPKALVLKKGDLSLDGFYQQPLERLTLSIEFLSGENLSICQVPCLDAPPTGALPLVQYPCSTPQIRKLNEKPCNQIDFARYGIMGSLKPRCPHKFP
ncbi:hypothetical protein TNCV_4707811 [Trichonephila clavipes]|nr:hypothetical protein TNCV_4707811 [Trichonephila clavipes]